MRRRQRSPASIICICCTTWFHSAALSASIGGASGASGVPGAWYGLGGLLPGVFVGVVGCENTRRPAKLSELRAITQTEYGRGLFVGGISRRMPAERKVVWGTCQHRQYRGTVVERQG